MTWIYFVFLKDESAGIQQSAYSVGKLIQFSFPLIWVLLFQKEHFRHQQPSSANPPRRAPGPTGMWIGVLFGTLVVALMFGVYFGFLQGTELSQLLVDRVRAKTVGTGIDSHLKFAALGLFYALGHSFLEEYYWRWFVFGILQKVAPVPFAVTLSSIGFMAHHVILLAVFFGWSSPWTYVFAMAVGIGGAFWAWLYHHTGTLLAPWVSHLIVDAGIFGLGYFLIRPFLAG